MKEICKYLFLYILKEILIASLKLTYLDGKRFSKSAKSEFLSIKIQEIIYLTKKISKFADFFYSTVTDLAKFLGLSMSHPLFVATLYDKSCKGMIAKMDSKMGCIFLIVIISS